MRISTNMSLSAKLIMHMKLDVYSVLAQYRSYCSYQVWTSVKSRQIQYTLENDCRARSAVALSSIWFLSLYSAWDFQWLTILTPDVGLSHSLHRNRKNADNETTSIEQINTGATDSSKLGVSNFNPLITSMESIKHYKNADKLNSGSYNVGHTHRNLNRSTSRSFSSRNQRSFDCCLFVEVALTMIFVSRGTRPDECGPITSCTTYTTNHTECLE